MFFNIVERYKNFRAVFHELNKKICCRNDEESEIKRRLDNLLFLEHFGYKVYSQNDEDGIIEEIFNRIGTTNRKFVEFGVQNGLESNGHFLLHKGWSGLWIEGDKKIFNQLCSIFKRAINNGRLSAINAFITIENINQLISDKIGGGRQDREVDLLSIDIDGNDYWIWKAIKCIDPRVVVIEYNAKFPPTYEWIMKYDAKHIWCGDDEQGASLKSLELLGTSLGYQLVGTCMKGVNAFFVKKQLAKDLFPQPTNAENLYNPLRRYLVYKSGHPAQKYIGND
jgi:hypothetical protein